MPKTSGVQYNPLLSVKEIAKNSIGDDGKPLKESTVRAYIKSHKIDRRAEQKIQIIQNCRKYVDAHPNATMGEVRRMVKTGKKNEKGEPILYSIITIKKYWDEIRRKKPINIDSNEGKKITEISDNKGRKSTKSYPLMSELLQQAKGMLKIAEQEDVSALSEWLFSNPSMPLLCVGNGGKHSSFPALLYELNNGVAKAITPLEFASMSNAAVKSCKILLTSSGGRNMDITYAAKRAARLNRANTACLCFEDNGKNAVVKTLKGNNCFVFKHDLGEGFISILGKFLSYGLFYKAFSKEEHFADRLNFDLPNEECFKYEVNKEGKLPSLKDIKHIDILYGGFGEPIAREMESTLTEGGLCSVSITDYRNYCHGRFILTSNQMPKLTSSNLPDSAILLLTTPREKRIANQLRERVFPDTTPVITINTRFVSALASLDLLYKSSAFISVFGEKEKGNNPNNPLNPQSIDKRVPKSDIEFEDDLKKFGALSFSEPDFEEQRRINKQRVEDFIDKEKEATAYLEATNPTIQYPTVADLTNKREEYDATKVLTYAFRRSKDLRKGKSIPLGNMCQGFSFKVYGVPFYNSESAYIAGMFSNNTTEHIEVQNKLIAEKNGYTAKKTIRHDNESIARKDWEEYNVDWMLYVVWQKVKKNPRFKKLLISIPDNAIIIEDSTYQTGATSSFWGAKNETRKEFSKAVELQLESDNLDISYEEEDKQRDAVVNEYCNMGTYVGSNVMGKILTICRRCLADGTEPAINYELLKSKHIHLLGNEINFDKPYRAPKTKKEPVKKKELKQGKYTIVELHDFAEAKSYEADFGICYCKKENKFNYYTDNSKGKLYLCLKDGYKDLIKPKVPKGETFDKYDEYSSSAIGVSIGADGVIKAINSRYPWNNGGTDSDYSKEELEFMIDKPFDEAFEIPKGESSIEKVEKPKKKTKREIPEEEKSLLLGTIAGDMIGKPYEFTKNAIHTTEFPLFEKRCKYTDDTVLTIAVMDWLMMDSKHKWDTLVDRFLHYGTRYRIKGRDRCFSDEFAKGWLLNDNREWGRKSLGNGAAMRVAPVGWYFNTVEEVEEVAKIQASLTHNEPEAIEGAQVAAVAVLLARQGKSKDEIKSFIEERYGWKLTYDMDDYRKNYERNYLSKETVEGAVVSFLCSTDFESSIRNSVSLGSDSDTLAAINGSIAEAFYGEVPEHIKKEVLRRAIPDEFKDVLKRFNKTIR